MNAGQVGFGTAFSKHESNASASQNDVAKGGFIKRTFLPKVFKQQLNSIGGPNSLNKENRCPFPIRPTTKQERSDYAMIEESVLENERRGSWNRVYPSEYHL